MAAAARGLCTAAPGIAVWNCARSATIRSSRFRIAACSACAKPFFVPSTATVSRIPSSRVAKRSAKVLEAVALIRGT